MVFHKISASEIWPGRKGGLCWEWPFKRGVLHWLDKGLDDVIYIEYYLLACKTLSGLDL